MTQHKLLGISGALRQASTNTALVKEAARAYGEADFTLADLNLPLFNEDDEIATGIPAKVQKLADQIAEADAVVISTPEYNKNLPGVLKNALDWVSRTKGNPWAEKPVAITSAAGWRGGDRATHSLVLCLLPFSPRLIYGPEVMVANAGKELETGRLQTELYIKALDELMGKLRAAVG